MSRTHLALWLVFLALMGMAQYWLMDGGWVVIPVFATTTAVVVLMLYGRRSRGDDDPAKLDLSR